MRIKATAAGALALCLVAFGAALPASAGEKHDDKKTTICHVTHSETNPDETIEVANEAVLAAHLAHGDYLGACVVEPVDPPPVDNPPVDEPPVDEPPVDNPPTDEPPVDPPVDEEPVDPPVDVVVTDEVWWELPDGGTPPDHVTWPQPIADENALDCGVWYQVDTYDVRDIPALIADGVLTYGEDFDVVISWRFVFGGECVPDYPGDIVTVTDGEPVTDCDAVTVSFVRTTSTSTGTLVDNAWVYGEPVITSETITREATAIECPPVIDPPVECDDDQVLVDGECVAIEHPPVDPECDEGEELSNGLCVPADEPNPGDDTDKGDGDAVTGSAPQQSSLAVTGADPWGALSIAALLMLIGLGMKARRRVA